MACREKLEHAVPEIEFPAIELAVSMCGCPKCFPMLPHNLPGTSNIILLHPQSVMQGYVPDFLRMK